MDGRTHGLLLATTTCVFALVYCLLDGTLAHVVRRGTQTLSRACARIRSPSLCSCSVQAAADRRSILRDMPAFLDILILGLSAGLSFDASLELYCTRYATRLSAELTDAMLLWRMGVRSRSEALEEMADRVDVAAFTRFAATVSEALAFGTPLSDSLERQASVIRDEQRALVEAEIEKAPVKMIVPLGVLIMPAMLLAILGPLLGPAIGLA